MGEDESLSTLIYKFKVALSNKSEISFQSVLKKLLTKAGQCFTWATVASVSVVFAIGKSECVTTKLVVAAVRADIIGVGLARNNDIVFASSSEMEDRLLL